MSHMAGTARAESLSGDLLGVNSASDAHTTAANHLSAIASSACGVAGDCVVPKGTHLCSPPPQLRVEAITRSPSTVQGRRTSTRKRDGVI